MALGCGSFSVEPCYALIWTVKTRCDKKCVVQPLICHLGQPPTFCAHSKVSPAPD
jgi:hypothetical protein